MVTGIQLATELRLEKVNTLIAESIGMINEQGPSMSIQEMNTNLVKMRVLTGALKTDIKLLSGEQI